MLNPRGMARFEGFLFVAEGFTADPSIAVFGPCAGMTARAYALPKNTYYLVLSVLCLLPATCCMASTTHHYLLRVRTAYHLMPSTFFY